MNNYYQVDQNGMKKITNENTENKNLTIYRNSTRNDRKMFIQKYQLPQDIFDFDEEFPVSPRIEMIENNTLIFVVSSIQNTSEKTDVEKRFESHTFVLIDEKLFWFMEKYTAHLDEELYNEKKTTIYSLAELILEFGLKVYKKFVQELDKQKRTIDRLNAQAVHTTDQEVLVELADTERNLVMLEHTLKIQEKCFNDLLEYDHFTGKISNDFLIRHLKWYIQQVNKLINIYRDLLDTTSSLFSDIMSSNLNKIMKFLSSLSLVFAAVSLVSSLWGMNTGGLPLDEEIYGTIIISGVAILAGFIMYLFLKKKDYFD